jgi:hypothetical protein
MKKTLVEYGRVSMKRVYCHDCGSDTLVRDGKKICCGETYYEHYGETMGFKRECEADGGARICPPALRAKIIESQGHRCFYCDSMLGGYAKRGHDTIRLRAQIDHQVPWAWMRDTSEKNLVAACHVCNGIKSSLMFGTLEECKDYIAAQRIKKGYNF